MDVDIVVVELIHCCSQEVENYLYPNTVSFSIVLDRFCLFHRYLVFLMILDPVLAVL